MASSLLAGSCCYRIFASRIIIIIINYIDEINILGLRLIDGLSKKKELP